MERLKHAWRRLRDAPPGRRFQESYLRRHRQGGAGAWHLAAGIAVLVLGIVLLPAPGPGILVVAVGAVMVCEHSRRFALALDRAELWLRAKLGAPARD